MVQIIKPKSNPQSRGETQADKIPTDPNGIKKYLEVIPEPVGYRMLVRPYQPAEKTKGGVILADTTRETIQMTTVVGLVVKMGDLCFQDKEKFPFALVKKDSLLYMEDTQAQDFKLIW